MTFFMVVEMLEPQANLFEVPFGQRFGEGPELLDEVA